MYGSYLVTRQGLLFYTSDIERRNQRFREREAEASGPMTGWDYGTEQPKAQRTQTACPVSRRVRELEERVDELDNAPVDLSRLKKRHLTALCDELDLDSDYLDKIEMIELLSGHPAVALRKASRAGGVSL